MFNERVSNVKPKSSNPQDEELVCEDAQSFLKKYYGVSPVKKPVTLDSSKFNLSNYGTNVANTSTPKNTLLEGDTPKHNMLKNISTGKLPSNYKDMYGSNTNTGEKIDASNKEEILKKIKNAELEKLRSKPSNGEKKEGRPDILNLKKRLDDLKNSKKA